MQNITSLIVMTHSKMAEYRAVRLAACAVIDNLSNAECKEICQRYKIAPRRNIERSCNRWREALMTKIVNMAALATV